MSYFKKGVLIGTIFGFLLWFAFYISFQAGSYSVYSQDPILGTLVNLVDALSFPTLLFLPYPLNLLFFWSGFLYGQLIYLLVFYGLLGGFFFKWYFKKLDIQKQQGIKSYFRYYIILILLLLLASPYYGRKFFDNQKGQELKHLGAKCDKLVGRDEVFNSGRRATTVEVAEYTSRFNYCMKNKGSLEGY